MAGDTLIKGWLGISLTHLRAKLLPTTECASIYFGDEDCTCDTLKEAAASDELSEGRLPRRCHQIAQIEMGDEEIGYGRGEDDDFRSGLAKPRLRPN